MEIIIMKYLTGIHALNLPCNLDTSGDWHTSALKWQDLTWRYSEQSIFKDYGIEIDRSIKFINMHHVNIANHIRALLDLLDEQNYPTAEGMKEDFICNDKYTLEIFSKVSMLRYRQYWNNIDTFMHKEYGEEWKEYSINQRDRHA